MAAKQAQTERTSTEALASASNHSCDRFANNVRWCEIAGIVFVLDIAEGVFSALSASTSQQWLSYANGARCDEKLERALDHRRWLPSREFKLAAPPSSIKLGHCLPRSIGCLLTARRLTKRHGFELAYSWAKHHKPLDAATETSDIEQTLRCFRRAEGLLWSPQGDMDCLPRSLALFATLKGYGFNVEHLIGIYRFPFSAHAWVELEGKELLERTLPQSKEDGALGLRAIILRTS